MDGAEESGSGVDGTGELERFGATDFTDDDDVGAHTENELHQVAQRDLAAAVERRGTSLVVLTVQGSAR